MTDSGKGTASVSTLGTSENKCILILAAENDMLPGAKVGGVGDVIRDLPPALVKQECKVSVVLPSYGKLARLPGLSLVGNFEIHFAGFPQAMTLYKLSGDFNGVDNYIIHNPGFAPQGETVYCNDPDWRPFATDATKFAMYCQAVAVALKKNLLTLPDVIHLHDWHTAFLLILREYSNNYSFLKKVRCVFTVHNLALQGVRPFKNDDSALETWYPELAYDGTIISDLENPHCVNPMRAAINLADKVSTVSPTYADEILQKSDHAKGIYGGEGLEGDLHRRALSGDLLGILNGCSYAKKLSFKKPARVDVANVAKNCIIEWSATSRHMRSAHWIADQRIDELKKSRKSRFVLTSVGRITEQKARLFQTVMSDGKCVLHTILDLLGDEGLFILLGSGDTHLEDFITQAAGKYNNLLFLNGYSDTLSNMIYSYGDLFIMPSSFEPCGISQMLAMRAGQPCLVNAVGGLKDTVRDGDTGFVFKGDDIQQQAKALLSRLQDAMRLYKTDPESWGGIRHRASQQRFTWKAAAKVYIEKVY